MPSKPETRGSSKFWRYLPEWVYAEKTHNRFRIGVPDYYLEGRNGKIMWVEMKWWEKAPEADVAWEDIGKREKSWYAQQRWLARAWKAGVNVKTIVMCPDGVIVLHRPPFDFRLDRDRLLSIKDACAGLVAELQ